MDSISQEISDYIEQRVAAALLEKDERVKKLEQDKAKLIRMASELKNEVKNMRLTVAMFEKQMANPSRPLKRFEHKCVGCDFRMLPPVKVPSVSSSQYQTQSRPQSLLQTLQQPLIKQNKPASLSPPSPPPPAPNAPLLMAKLTSSSPPPQHSTSSSVTTTHVESTSMSDDIVCLD